MDNYLKKISRPDEVWAQIDDTDYWVSSEYRVVSTKRGTTLIQPYRNKGSQDYWVILFHNYKRTKYYLNKYVAPLIKMSERKKLKRERIERATKKEVISPKQKELDDVKRYVLTLLEDEKHEDFDHYCKVIAESRKACQGKSTCISAYD